MNSIRAIDGTCLAAIPTTFTINYANALFSTNITQLYMAYKLMYYNL